jgi:hypothetical protein
MLSSGEKISFKDFAINEDDNFFHQNIQRRNQNRKYLLDN